MDTIDARSRPAARIFANRIFLNISKIDEDFVLYSRVWDKMSYSKISYHIYSQWNLLLVSFYMILIFVWVAFLISFYFVKSSLKNLNYLVRQTKDLDLNNLNTNVEIDWPDEDEIKIVWDTINKSLIKLNKQAKSLKDFISNASHELKTPLMEISSQLDMLSLESKDISTKDDIQNVKETIKKMNMIIENLLLLAKLESQWGFNMSNVNVSDVLQQVLDWIHQKYMDKQINIENQIQKNVHLYTNQYLFELLVKNLIENAYKYTDPWWKITVVLDNEKLIISDTWVGIKKKNMEKVRESFYQEDESKTDDKSFGLGLYIVKSIVSSLGFQIHMESELWKWTDFIIYFW